MDKRALIASLAFKIDRFRQSVRIGSKIGYTDTIEFSFKRRGDRHEKAAEGNKSNTGYN